MKTKAAVLWGLNEKWQVEEVELDAPKESEVLVRCSMTRCWATARYRTTAPA